VSTSSEAVSRGKEKRGKGSRVGEGEKKEEEGKGERERRRRRKGKMIDHEPEVAWSGGTVRVCVVYSLIT